MDPKKEIFSIYKKKVFVAGHNGMVGRALVKRLKTEDCELIITDRKKTDLRDQNAVSDWFSQHKPDVVFIAAAKVGGIQANRTFPVDFILDNLQIQNAIISAAFQNKVEKLIFLGSSCIYPRNAQQPLTESALLSGELESTNEYYAIAKIAGIKLCQAYRKQYGVDFICAMPANLYGPGDNYHVENSHVVAALIRRFYEAVNTGAKKLTLWGTGTPLREFLNVDDLADGLVFLTKHYSKMEPINIGTGEEVTIIELAQLLREIAQWQGQIVLDPKMPDGTKRKVMDITKITALGWKAKTDLRKGLVAAYDWYVQNYENVRA